MKDFSMEDAILAAALGLLSLAIGTFLLTGCGSEFAYADGQYTAVCSTQLNSQGTLITCPNLAPIQVVQAIQSVVVAEQLCPNSTQVGLCISNELYIPSYGNLVLTIPGEYTAPCKFTVRANCSIMDN